MRISFISSPARTLGGFLLILGLTAGCAAPTLTPSAGINDPAEGANRTVHAFNKGADTLLLRPASQVYGAVLPSPVRTGVSNMANNLGEPATILNHTLQGDLGAAARSTGRFLVNTTFGLGGLFDPATALGSPEDETDFGETLHVWGAGEGAYVELPLLGPSTTRDAAGTVVDALINPLSIAVGSPEIDYARGINIASGVGQRYRFSDTIDGVLYESADSYAQSRLIYLQNRRFELGQTGPGGDSPIDTQGDLYDDLYFE